MPVEIEAKMKVPSHDATRTKLKALGASYVGMHLETNIFFDTRDRSLVAADKGLRLRINRNVATKTAESIITFKGPRQPGKFKNREEIELVVDSSDNATDLMNLLGYEQVLSFEKKRETWMLDDCKVELDELPHLGTFVEVEGPSEASVGLVREKLGLGGASSMGAGYAGMLTTHLQDIGSSERTIVFPRT